MLIRELTFAAIGTGFTCLATVLGAAMVFFFREDLKPATQKIFLGFAAGVMVAASVWSLLIPSMEMAEEMGQSPALPVGGGSCWAGLSSWSWTGSPPISTSAAAIRKGCPPI